MERAGDGFVVTHFCEQLTGRDATRWMQFNHYPVFLRIVDALLD
jgi:hypothetical protein